MGSIIVLTTKLFMKPLKVLNLLIELGLFLIEEVGVLSDDFKGCLVVIVEFERRNDVGV
jgi:hypothetical protein